MGAGELVALVEERFGVVVTAATPFYEAPEKAIYRLDRAGGGPLVVRLFPADRPLDRVVGDAAVLRHLEAEDIPAERVVTALDGSPSVRLGPRGVLVTRLIPGGPPGLTADALEQMGATLGRLHALPVEQARLPDAVRFRPLAVAARTLAEATAQGRPPPEGAWWTGSTRAGEVAARALG